MSIADLKNCFKLPWTQEENPNGWIEPTTYCNLKCPGCYRGVDKEGHKPYHLPVTDIKQQIDWLIQNRNIQTLSIAGGDPLLYPQLDEVVDYAFRKGLRIMIYTNGIDLDLEKLVSLKKAGATQIMVHIDKFQNRTKNNTETELIVLRNEYCKLFRKVKGVNLGFIQPLTPECLVDLNLLNRFFIANRDIISIVVFSLYREISWTHKIKPQINTDLSLIRLIKALEDGGFYKPCSYLQSLLRNEPTWIFSYSIGTKNKILGFLNSKTYEIIQESYYRKFGRHRFISRNTKIRRTGLLKLIGLKGMIKIFIKSLMYFRPLYFQTILLLRGPVYTGIEWDLCDGCPDAMLYKGKLVASCILEDIIYHENPSK